MTTIAYKDGVLAADTLMTNGSARCGHKHKILRQGRVLIGFAGKSTNFEAFRNWIAEGMPGKFKSEDGNVFIVPPEGPAVVWGAGDTPWREAEPFWALGSGDDFAMGAMAVGASAEEAVRAAMQFDTGSGGEVTVLRLRADPSEEAMLDACCGGDSYCGHTSHCAVHNEPAYPAGPCDCGFQ